MEETTLRKETRRNGESDMGTKNREWDSFIYTGFNPFLPQEAILQYNYLH